MSPHHAALLLIAGCAGGLTGSIAGLASLVTYPALLLVGLPPVTANVTNSVALTFGSVGSVAGSQPELLGRAALLKRLTPIAAISGLAGAALLLTLPGRTFGLVVPWLLGFGSLVIALPLRSPRRTLADPGAQGCTMVRPGLALEVGIAAIGIYSGYFGAGAGVLLIALLLATSDETFSRCNGLKNALAGAANFAAALSFMIVGHIDWVGVAPLGAGLMIGGAIGPSFVRIAPPKPIRAGVCLAGLGLSIYLAAQAYG